MPSKGRIGLSSAAGRRFIRGGSVNLSPILSFASGCVLAGPVR